MRDVATYSLTEHALQDLVGPREQSEDVPRRERYMEEEAQFEPEILLLGRLSDPICGQHQMIVVNPYQWRAVGLILLFLVNLPQSADLRQQTDSSVATAKRLPN